MDNQDLIRLVLNQIDFYQKKYHAAKRELQDICLMHWYKRIFISRRIDKFLKESLFNNRESETLIENFANFAENDPELFRFYREFYDKKSTKNN